MRKFYILIIAAITLSAVEASGEALHTWIVPWDKVSTEHLSCFDSVSPFAYALSSAGVFAAHPDLVAQGLDLKAKGVKVTPAVVNDVYAGGKMRDLKSPTILDGLFGDEPATERHIKELLAVAEPFDGLEIDYERVPDNLMNRYVKFLEGLGTALHARGKTLYVDLEPWPLGRSEIAARWWPELVKHVDGVRLMAYYERGGATLSPVPGNSLDWVVALAKKAQALIPAAKLEVVISLAATDWRSSVGGLPPWRGERLHYGRARKLIEKHKSTVKRDANGMPYARMKRAGRRHELWLEDAQSLDAKITALRAAGVQKIALWYWGADHPTLAACAQ